MDETRGVGVPTADGEDVVFTLGPDGRFEHYSEELVTATGVDEDILETIDPLALFAPADRDAVRGAIGRCLGEREASTGAALLAVDGNSRPCRVRLTRYTDRDGSPTKIYGLIEVGVDAGVARSGTAGCPTPQCSD